MRTTTHTSSNYTEEVHAKSLKKGDHIWVGRRVYKVVSNTENDYNQRVLKLKWGSSKKKDGAMIIVPAKLVFVVNHHRHHRIK